MSKGTSRYNLKNSDSEKQTFLHMKGWYYKFTLDSKRYQNKMHG